MLRSLLISWLLLLHSVTAVQAAVIINEVHPQPESGSEWIELYNDASEPVTLAGWQLEDVLASASILHTFAAETVIVGNSFVVIPVSNKLNNAADGVVLKNTAGEVLDSMSYDASSLGLSWSRQLVNSAWLLQAPSQGVTNPAASPPSSPVPTPSPSFSPNPSPMPFFDPYDITLSEIMACPSDNQSEWVELFNGADLPLTLEQWRISDWAGNTRSFSLTLQPKSLASVSWLSSLLNNSGDSLFLENNLGDIIAAASFGECTADQSFVWSNNQWQVTTTPTRNSTNVVTLKPSPSPTPSPSPRASPSPTPLKTTQPSSTPTVAVLGTETNRGSNPNRLSRSHQPTTATTSALPTELQLTTGPINQNEPTSKSEFIAVRPSKVNLWSAFSVILGGLLIATNSLYILYDHYEHIFARSLA